MKVVGEIQSDLLPVKVFAKRLGISVWMARQAAYAGKIDSVKIGTKLLIPSGEVDRMIRENLRPRVADSASA
jgi:hypothetical protein